MIGLLSDMFRTATRTDARVNHSKTPSHDELLALHQLRKERENQKQRALDARFYG